MKKEDEIAERLKSREFDPEREVVLEEEPFIRRSSFVVRRSLSRETVEIIKYGPNEVVIRAVVAERPKFLFLSDTYYPGWKVFVDGRRDRIYQANFCFRAVYLAPGVHAVRFIFDPFTFKFGAIVSLATLAAIAAYFIRAAGKRKAKAVKTA